MQQAIFESAAPHNKNAATPHFETKERHKPVFAGEICYFIFQ